MPLTNKTCLHGSRTLQASLGLSLFVNAGPDNYFRHKFNHNLLHPGLTQAQCCSVNDSKCVIKSTVLQAHQPWKLAWSLLTTTKP